jgi:cyclopropane-fatty-acyl-phospholipid synthase
MRPDASEGRSFPVASEVGNSEAVSNFVNVTSKRRQVARDASELLIRLFKNFTGQGAIRLWDGTTVLFGSAAGTGSAPSPFTLVFHRPEVIGSMVLGWDRLRLAEAYFRGDIDIEGDFFQALGLKDQLSTIRLSWLDRLRVLRRAARLLLRQSNGHSLAPIEQPQKGGRVKIHSRSENSIAVQFHYDLSNEFYALWLDRAMVYSCAYFQSADDGLEHAQTAKLDLICRKLCLQPGDRLLDIGCGWGALVIHAAKHYGVEAHGVTLSHAQLALAQARVDGSGLQHHIKVEYRDYRDLDGLSVYDKISSVGMFEHVGLNNLPTYFATVHRLLKPSGLFLNHGITHDVEGWKTTLSTEFINRYIFPDGQLDTVSNVQRVMEGARFEIEDVESLRSHYALTLRHWVARLEAKHAQALHHVNEATYRVWRLYMAACALEFETGEIGVYQLLASKRDGGLSTLPLTRRRMLLDLTSEPGSCGESALLDPGARQPR